MKVTESHKGRQGNPTQESFLQHGSHGLRRCAVKSRLRGHLGSSLLQLEWLFSHSTVYKYHLLQLWENADSRASSCPTHIFSQCVCNQTQQFAFLGNTLMVGTDLTLRNGALMISANGRFHLVTSKDETIAYGQEFAVKSSVSA